MNTWSTKRLVDANRVVTIKADKTDPNQSTRDIDLLLQQLGNEGRTIPFYAIYPADGRSPIVLEGPISKRQIGAALREAGPSKDSAGAVTAAREPSASSR